MAHSTVGSLLRSTQAYCLQLCEKETLEFGIAYYSKKYPALPEANQYREVIATGSDQLDRAFAESQAWFESQGLSCHRWAPADGSGSSELADFLTDRGFALRRLTAMTLTQWAELDAPDNVKVLPARAMRSVFRQTLDGETNHASPQAKEQAIEAYQERLDDPQLDMFVALVDKKPAGRCAMYQVGDIAQLIELHVSQAYADRGVKEALTAHVLALAKRLAMRNICLQVDSNDTTLQAWFQSAGFVEDGTLVEFDRQVSEPSSRPA